MHDPLHRLYRTKLALLAAVLLGVGLLLLIFGNWADHAAGWSWIRNLPVVDIGSGMFTTGLLGVAWQYLDGSDSEARDTERLQRVLADTAPAMRDAVIEGFAFEPEDIARVATPEVLDKIIVNGLGIRLGEREFAQEIYDDLRDQTIGNPERLYDARISIRLSMDRGTAKGRARYFVATIRWEYRLKPAYAVRRFVCLSDLDEFRELDQDTAATSAWYVPRRSGLDAEKKSTFELVEFTVDGEQRPVRRTVKTEGQTFTVNLGHEAMTAPEPISVAFTYRTLLAVDGHLLQLRVDQPTRGFSVELDYGDTGLDFVSVLDFIASSHRTTLSRSPSSVPGKTVSLGFSGWVLPRNGVVLVWPSSER